MQIIAGTARSIILTVPKGLAVRPTSVRARKALFDSLGSFSGLKVVDFFAGSGALGLEAASRGASEVAFVENARLHCQVIEQNIAKVIKAGASESLKVTCSNVAGCFFPALMKNPDIIFADPPYEISAEIFTQLTADKNFITWAAGALLVWEIPDETGSAGKFLEVFRNGRIRKFGGTEFLLAKIPELQN